MRITEPLLETQHFFADDREAEVSRLDHAGVDRAHSDFVDTITGDGDEWIVCFLRIETARFPDDNFCSGK